MCFAVSRRCTRRPSRHGEPPPATAPGQIDDNRPRRKSVPRRQRRYTTASPQSARAPRGFARRRELASEATPSESTAAPPMRATVSAACDSSGSPTSNSTNVEGQPTSAKPAPSSIAAVTMNRVFTIHNAVNAATIGQCSFPGSAWERTAGRLCLPGRVGHANSATGRRSRAAASSQAEPGYVGGC